LVGWLVGWLVGFAYPVRPDPVPTQNHLLDVPRPLECVAKAGSALITDDVVGEVELAQTRGGLHAHIATHE
jgi:hypothetical protein